MVGIVVDFVLKGLQAGETALAPEEVPQFQGDALAVQVSGVVQKPRLDGEVVTVYCGTGPDVGDSQMHSILGADLASIDPLGWEEKLR